MPRLDVWKADLGVPRGSQHVLENRQSVGGFLPRDVYISADYAVARCLSVRLSHAGIVSKRLNLFSNFSPSGGSTAPPIIIINNNNNNNNGFV